MTKVTIIVPVYNSEKYIERCIESLINQTLQEIEIIIIDDGSKDNTSQICDEYEKKDNRIKVIHKINEGAGIARNKGLEIATGEYIGFLDSDDYVDRSMFEILYKKAKLEDVQACFCGSNKVKDNFITKGEEIEDAIYDKKRILKESIPYICSGGEGQKIKGAIAVWHGIYNLAFIKENNISFFSEREFLSEDTLFNLIFFIYSDKIAFINKHLHYQCIIEESLSKVSMPFSLDAARNFYYFVLKYIKEHGEIEQKRCLNILRKRYLRECRGIIAKKIKKESDKKKIRQSLKKLYQDEILKEIIRNKKSIISILSLKDKIFLSLIQYRCSTFLKLIFQFSKLVK